MSPLPRSVRLMAVWLAAAGVFGAALAAANADRNALDDPDLAHQRPGFLDALHPAFPAPGVVEDLPAPGRRLIVFFVRSEQEIRLRRALAGAAALQRNADVVIVTPAAATAARGSAITATTDPGGRIAAAYRMPRPRDGGPPVGYAIVDRRGNVRYETLDPGVAHRLDEVETMLRATQ